MTCPDHLPARTAGSPEGSPGQEGPLAKLLHLEGQGGHHPRAWMPGGGISGPF